MEQQRKCRNRYVDIGPLREYDVNVIKNALAMYADCAESAIENAVGIERISHSGFYNTCTDPHAGH